MTVKAPAAPTAPTQVNLTPEAMFWKKIMEVQALVADTAYGVGAGKGGSTLKDSNALKKDAHEMLRQRNITYDVVAKDVKLDFVGERTYVSGYYTDNWYMDGILVYSADRFAGFDVLISPSTNSNYAVQGANTSASTQAMFNMLKANTKSDEELSEDRAKHEKRQSPRPAANIGSDVPY